MRWIITLLGASIGPLVVAGIISMLQLFRLIARGNLFESWMVLIILLLSGVGSGIGAWFLAPKVIRGFEKLESRIQAQPAGDLMVAAGGLLMGLLIALLLSNLVNYIPLAPVRLSISLLLYLTLGYLGVSVAMKKREDLRSTFKVRRNHRGVSIEQAAPQTGGVPKVLDTSVIIDGRILDILKTGFLEGPLVIPQFMLTELRYIADSSDDLKRNRGRRGLDILNKIQQDTDIEVRVVEDDNDTLPDVDSKLLWLAHSLGGKVVTNDYNLNKVAGVQSVPVLNINDLANAVKPVALPGEHLQVHIVKDGKEPGQGVAYLSDGTMVVVEGGTAHVNEDVQVVVTSSLQTSAGRMIFGRLQEAG